MAADSVSDPALFLSYLDRVNLGFAALTMNAELKFTPLYVLRFLLGVAEAGFFPGIILYLTYWYPAEYRARFLAAFAVAVPVST